AEAAAPLTVRVLKTPGAALLQAARQVLRDEVADFPAKARLLRRVAEIHEPILRLGQTTVKCPNMDGSCGFALRREHRPDDVAAAHGIERLAPALERGDARHHRGEVKPPFERPMGEPGEVLRRE